MPKFDIEKGSKSAGRRVVNSSTANSGRAKANDDFKKELQQMDRTASKDVETRLAPDRIVEPRCKVCTHPFRDWMEMMLIKGMPYKTLADRVTPPVDRRSLSNHYNNHMDLQDAALRSIIEQEAKIQGINHEEGVQDIVTKRAVLEIALRKGHEDILNGVTTVEPRDLIQIAKVLAEMDSQQQQMGLDEVRSQMQLFLQAIRDVCSPEIQGAIGNRVGELRRRENITGEYEKLIEPPKEITDATVIEEE